MGLMALTNFEFGLAVSIAALLVIDLCLRHFAAPVERIKLLSAFILSGALTASICLVALYSFRRMLVP